MLQVCSRPYTMVVCWREAAIRPVYRKTRHRHCCEAWVLGQGQRRRTQRFWRRAMALCSRNSGGNFGSRLKLYTEAYM